MSRKTPFSLSKKVGLHSDAPEADSMVFIHEELKGAVDIDFILINDIPESKDANDYTFDTGLGKIDRDPKVFNSGDVIVIQGNKIIQ